MEERARLRLEATNPAHYFGVTPVCALPLATPYPGSQSSIRDPYPTPRHISCSDFHRGWPIKFLTIDEYVWTLLTLFQLCYYFHCFNHLWAIGLGLNILMHFMVHMVNLRFPLFVQRAVAGQAPPLPSLDWGTCRVGPPAFLFQLL